MKFILVSLLCGVLHFCDANDKWDENVRPKMVFDFTKNNQISEEIQEPNQSKGQVLFIFRNWNLCVLEEHIISSFIY